MGSGMMTGLNQMSEGLISALNTTGRTFNTPPGVVVDLAAVVSVEAALAGVVVVVAFDNGSVQLQLFLCV